MEEWVNFPKSYLQNYAASFKNLTDDQIRNFRIKTDHSLRVADNILLLADVLQLDENERKTALLAGIFHDIGRFPQLVEYNTFYDEKSVDHAEKGVSILKENNIIGLCGSSDEEIIYKAIEYHNKLELPKKLTDRELLHTRLLRDADKLDILHVLSSYYTSRNADPNHTLTWELPKGTAVSPGAAREILSGKLVSKKEVVSELDVKIMQLSWVYDINFRATIDLLLNKRYLEKIYSSMPKNDLIIEIYRKVKVYAENRLLEERKRVS